MKYYIARNYRSKFDAAGKAKMDCEVILKNNGWKNIGFKQTWIANAIIGTIVSAIGITWAIIRLPRKSTLCLQYPLNKFYKYILWGAIIKKCDIITIVHDVKSLKGKLYLTKKEIKTLSKSKSLIVHNSVMREWFENNNIGAEVKITELDIFDYLHHTSKKQNSNNLDINHFKIVFAGNTGGKKSFLYDVDYVQRGNFHIDIYGFDFNVNFIKNKENSILNYKGVFPSNEIIDHINGDFGLVWYGDSTESCNGQTGQYLKFNNPHKVSLYIQCELPIIIWDQAAMANFVEENNIGITINNLDDLKNKLNSLSENDYNILKQNVLRIKSKISCGFYLETALNKAL